MFIRRGESWAADVCVQKKVFLLFPGLFLKVPTGAVCVLSYWWAEWFAIPHVLPLTCRQHIERSVNKYIDAVLLFFFGTAMATLSLRLFFRSNFNSLCARRLCTLYGECQSGNVLERRISHHISLLSSGSFSICCPSSKTGGHAEQ
jgi:hypothetical protein